MDTKAIEARARKELEEELTREAIDKAKARLRMRKSLLDRVFPFKILIVRK